MEQNKHSVPHESVPNNAFAMKEMDVQFTVNEILKQLVKYLQNPYQIKKHCKEKSVELPTIEKGQTTHFIPITKRQEPRQ